MMNKNSWQDCLDIASKIKERCENYRIEYTPVLASLTSEVEPYYYEKQEHLDFFDNIAKEKKIRPTKLKGLFGLGAYAMGVGTALMGPKAAYVCTEAVEEIIEKHYQKQIDQLEGVDEELREKLVKFRDDEVEHKNTAIDEGSREAFGYSVLRKTINETTKAAIFLAERI